MKFRFTSILILQLFSVGSFSQDTTTAKFVKADTIVDKLEIEASFSGGDTAWRHFLEKSLQHFNPADNGAPSGLYTVIVQFLVDREGKVTDIKTLTNEGYGMEQQVVRVLQKSGMWNPAILNGKPVKAYRKQPISFAVEQQGIEFISQKPYTLNIGVANELTIHANKIKDEYLSATITRGSILPMGNGQFKVRVSVPGRVVISVFNAKKDDKLLGAASFTVEPLKDKASD